MASGRVSEALTMDSSIRRPWECADHPTRSSRPASERARRTSADERGSGGGPGLEGGPARGGRLRWIARSVEPSKSAQPSCSAAGSSLEGSRQASQRAVRASDRSPIQSLTVSWSRAWRVGDSWPRGRQRALIPPSRLERRHRDDGFLPQGERGGRHHHAVGHPTGQPLTEGDCPCRPRIAGGHHFARGGRLELPDGEGLGGAGSSRARTVDL